MNSIGLSDTIKNNASSALLRLAKAQKTSALPDGRAHFILSEGDFMAVSYKKLWKLLIDRDMKKKDLCAIAGISTASVTKMGKGGHVTTEVLVKICTALECTVDEIMDIVPSVNN